MKRSNNSKKIHLYHLFHALKLKIQDELNTLRHFTFPDAFRLLIIVLCCLLFGTSVVVMPELKNGITTGKHFYFIFSAITLVLVSGLFLLRRRSVPFAFRITRTDLFVMAYLLYVTFHILLIQPQLLTANRFVELVFMTLTYFIGKKLITNGRRLEVDFMIMALMAFGFYQAFYGLQQLYGFESSHHSWYKVTGSFFNPAPYAGYLASILPVGLAVYLFTKQKSFRNEVFKYAGLITVLAILLIIPSTQSRASWIALIAGAAFVYSRYFDIPGLIKKYLNTTTKKVLVLVFAILILAASAIGLYHWKKESALGRILMWKVSSQVIVDNPLTGVGFNQFTRSFGDYQAKYFLSGRHSDEEVMVAGKGEYAFNEFLGIGVEEGLTGLLLFLGIVFFALKDIIIRKPDPGSKAFTIGAAGGLITLLVFSLFSYPFSITPLHLNFYFFLAILSVHQNKKSVFSIRLPGMTRYVLCLGLIVLCTWTAFYQLEKFTAMKEWQFASQMKGFGIDEEVIQIMQEIEPTLKNDGDFMFEYGQALTLNKTYLEGVKVLEKAALLTSDPYLFNSLGNCYQGLKMYEKAEAAYLHAFYLIPHKFYPRYLLAKMYEENGEIQKAKGLARKVKEMGIKVPSRAVNEILAEMDRILGIEE